MHEYRYLIVGGGMAADAAAKGIRSRDSEASIGLIGKESDPPYDRPPLTKGLWKGKNLDSIWRNTAEKGVDLHLGCEATRLEPDRHRVIDDAGNEYGYHKLLLATGGRPRRLPFGEQDVIYYRYAKDFRHLHMLAQSHSRFAVIGGGFVGSEIAAALAMNGKQVTQLFPDIGIGGLHFPPDLAQHLNEYFRQKGVRVLQGQLVAGIDRDGDQLVLHTDRGEDLLTSSVLAGIGIVPNTRIAEEAGLDVSDGIEVNTKLQTSHDDVYAAGDVARFYNAGLGKSLRVEHEDNALTMGEMAGAAMAGEKIDYDYLPYFYSDLFDVGYEAIGELNPDLQLFSDWQELYRKGVVYYLDRGRVRGVLLWNVWDKVDDARRLIYEPGPFKEADLRGRIQ